MGKEGIRNITNNCSRLFDFCEEYYFGIGGKIFQHKKMHKSHLMAGQRVRSTTLS